MPSIALTLRTIASDGRAVPCGTVVLLALLGVWRLWSLIETERAHQQPLVAQPLPARNGRAGIDIAAIQRIHLFGVSPTETMDAPLSTPMILVGVFATLDPAHGYAMLGASTTSIAVFQPGAEVAPGLRLKSVYQDYVLLEQAGVVSRVQISTPRPGLVAAMLRMDDPSPAAAGSLRVGNTQPKQPEDVLQVQVARSNGKFQGYRVRPGAEPEAFTRAGLRAGDVVVAVNGQRDDLLSVLRNDRKAQVTIVRNGAQQDLSLNLDGPT